MIQNQRRTKNRCNLDEACQAGGQHLAKHHAGGLGAGDEYLHGAGAFFRSNIGGYHLPVEHDDHVECKDHHIGVEEVVRLILAQTRHCGADGDVHDS